MRKAIRILLCAIPLLFTQYQDTHAGTTGKIAGQVTDTEGNPIPKANVVIEGTRRGTEAYEDGVYFLLLVEPGVHTLVASHVGYQTQKKTDVRVSSDYTTNVSFELEMLPISLDTLVVEGVPGSSGGWGITARKAQGPPVEPDKTASKYYVTAEDIEIVPIVKDAALWVGRQPGVQHDGRSIRQGSFDTEEEGYGHSGWNTTNPTPVSMTYVVDGVRMVNNDRRGTSMFIGTNRSSIQEIAVVSGVPEAEYGNMDAGIVNIVTKEGGRTHHGFLEYRYTLPGQRHFGLHAYDPRLHINPVTGKSRIRPRGENWLNEREDIGPDGLPGTADDTGRLVHVQPDEYTEISGYRLERSVSGPVGSKMTFHVSAQTDRQPAQLPDPALRDLPNFQMTGKLTYNLSQNLWLKAGGVFGGREGFVTYYSTLSMAPPISTALSRDRGIYLPAWQSGAGKRIDRDAMGYILLTHTLSPRTLYELRISRSDTRMDTSGVPDETSPIVWDHEGWFTAVSQPLRTFLINRQTRYNVRLDLSKQVTAGNLLKVGVDATWFRTYQWEQWSYGRPGLYSVFTMYDYYEAAINQYGKDGKMDYAPARTVQGRKVPDWNAARELDDPAWNGYKDYPRRAFQLSAYIQDKMEFEGIVVNVGLRMDAFFHRGKTRPEPVWSALPQNRYFPDAQMALWRQSQNPYPDDPTSFPVWDGRDMFEIMPRFGVSHPISERAAMHFSYGRFIVLPIFYAMYGQTWGSTTRASIHMDLNNDGRFSSYECYSGLAMRNTKRGSSQVRPGKTVSYEAGVDWNFVRDYTLAISAYYRRSEDYLFHNNTFLQDPVRKRMRKI